MRLLKQEGQRCMVYATAMLLDETVETVIKELGHDGTAVEWPDLDEPWCFRGVHIQEVQDLCLRRGYLLAPVEAMPAIGYDPTHMTTVYEDVDGTRRFLAAITGRRAILYGAYPGHKARHTVAWDGTRIYDPNNKITELEDFAVETAWILCTPLKHHPE